MLSKFVLALSLVLPLVLQAQEEEKENATDFAVAKLNAEIALDPLMKPISSVACLNILPSTQPMRVIVDVSNMEAVAAIDAFTSFSAYARLLSSADIRQLTPLEVGQRVQENYNEMIIEVQSQCIYQLALAEVRKDEANWEVNFTKKIDEVLFAPAKQALKQWRAAHPNAVQKFNEIAEDVSRKLVEAHAPRAPRMPSIQRTTIL